MHSLNLLVKPPTYFPYMIPELSMWLETTGRSYFYRKRGCVAELRLGL